MCSEARDFPNLRISNHPLIRHKSTVLRDERTTPKVFRELVRELTGLLLYEATTDLPVAEIEVQTPLELTPGWHLDERIGLVPILRAGLGMVDAAIDAIPGAVVYHLGMYRDETTHQPVNYYNKLPDICPMELVFVLDPMLATGGSAVDAVDALKTWGAPDIRFIAMIAAPEGVQRLYDAHPDIVVHAAALDRELDENMFIRPGLGDAGDRLFNTTGE
jgi:uracil phosphoribosyltransferase